MTLIRLRNVKICLIFGCLGLLGTILNGAILKPPFISEPVEIQKSAGESLTLTCNGDMKMNWTVPVFNQVISFAHLCSSSNL